ncbi:hypothetical protein EUTSA_v10000202mg [Eutrema salsugineum]|uniref:Uncharacterized protein n=2 Tax=Eutrema salsugineum TaxID=72664 RepID=V4LUV1_EUTSA|nr:hypothetical protein EUTSA_v10000202mg [Eutrema salsugineum]
MEILKRLPVKTLARFLCVSKLWACTIRRRDFMKLFLTESSNRPDRLFITFQREDNRQDGFFYSSHLTRNQGEASVATYQMKHLSYKLTTESPSVHGLFCYRTICGFGLAVYNSSTRRCITLPQFEHQSYIIQHLLGYDPIDGVYKVLCLTKPRSFFHTAEREPVFQVLTLGNEKSSWKVIENSHPHLPFKSQICIDGVVYYEAKVGTERKEVAVMSFDVRSEKFHVIKRPALSIISRTMIRYEGKLAIVGGLIPVNGSVDLWVLEDAVKHEWLRKTFVLPHLWTNLQDTRTSLPGLHRFIDVTDAGEFLLAPILLWVPLPPYYVLYYDPKRNSMRKVETEGITEHKLLRYKKGYNRYLFHVFSSQVESLMFL